MTSRQKIAHQVASASHFVYVGNGESDLVQFDLFPGPAASLADDNPLAETGSAGLDRDINVLVEILRRLIAATGPSRRAILHHPDDLILFLVQHDAFTHGALEGEQVFSNL